MHPWKFVGFDWNVGNPLTFKVLQCNSNPHKPNIVVNIGVVVPRNL